MTSGGIEPSDALPDETAWRLENRSGLPHALPLLTAVLPRDGWSGHPNFAGLTEYWLSWHAMFRELVSRIGADAGALSSGGMEPENFRHRLARLGGLLLNQLHGHHQVEDGHYFPLFVRREPDLARGFEILDRDHQVVAGWLGEFAGRSNALIAATATPGFQPHEAGAYHDWFTAFEPLLERHLSDEEDLVIPLLLRDGMG
jgi:hypothetical protein